MKVQRGRVAILSDLVRVARIENRPEGVGPSLVGYRKHGRYTETTVAKRAGMLECRWIALMERYGLTPAYNRRLRSERELVADVLRVAHLAGIGRLMPTDRQYRTFGKFQAAFVMRRLGGGRWHGVAERVGLTPQGRPSGNPLTKPALIAEYQRVAEKLGYARGGFGPGGVTFSKHSEYTYGAGQRLFGSWNALVKAAGYRVRTQKDRGPRKAPASESARRAA